MTQGENDAVAHALAVVGDPRSSYSQFARALRNLGDADVRPDFWTSIIRRPEYSATHRRAAVQQLFVRTVRPGMTIDQVSSALGPLEWLAPDDVMIVGDVAGHLPIDASGEDWIFALDVLPDAERGAEHWFVYLVASGALDATELSGALRGGEIDPAVGQIVINQVGFAPDVVDG